jgi:c-di-AMP phosphodiesterase-like protein
MKSTLGDTQNVFMTYISTKAGPRSLRMGPKIMAEHSSSMQQLVPKLMKINRAQVQNTNTTIVVIEHHAPNLVMKSTLLQDTQNVLLTYSFS